MVKKYSKWFTEQFPDFTEPNDSDLQEYSKKLRELRTKELELELQELELKEKKWQFQSLSNILDSIDFPKAPIIRNKFYKFLKELNLCEIEFKNPSDKSIRMGYALNKKEDPWYVWNTEILGLNCHGNWYSKSCISKFYSWKETWDLLRPYCSDDDLKTPTKQAIDKGLVKLQYLYEWHTDCVEEISNYFLDIYEVMKKEKIDFEQAKSKVEWLGEKGLCPGDESPMMLLGELDPEAFESINQLVDKIK